MHKNQRSNIYDKNTWNEKIIRAKFQLKFLLELIITDILFNMILYYLKYDINIDNTK